MEEPEDSIINIPFSVNRNAIELLINEQIKGLIYEDLTMDDDGLILKVEKAEPIILDYTPDSILYNVAVKLLVKKDITLAIAEARGIIKLHFETQYLIFPDWGLQTRTELRAYHWLQKPRAQLGRLDLSVNYLANLLLKRSKEIVGERIDQQLKSVFDLSKLSKRYWETFQNPIQLIKDWQLWALVKPNDFYLSPFNFETNEITTRFTLKANPVLVLSDSMPEVEVNALPAFQWREKEEAESFLFPVLQLAYDQLDFHLKKIINGRVIRIRQYKLKIELESFSGNPNELLLEILISDAFEGRARIKVFPVLEKEADTLRFELRAFDLSTKNILLKGIKKLFRNQLEKKLIEFMTFPLKEYRKKAIDFLNQKSRELIIHPQLDTALLIHDLQLKNIQMTSNDLILYLEIKGRMGAKVN